DNAPVNGVRPIAGFANIVEATSGAQSKNWSLITNLSWNLAKAPPSGPTAGGPPPPPPPGAVMMGGGDALKEMVVRGIAGGPAGAAPQKAPWFDWHKTTINVGYFLRRSTSNAIGGFTTAPSGNIADEWGPGPEDIRHTFNIGINSQAIRNMNINLSINGSTG